MVRDPESVKKPDVAVSSESSVEQVHSAPEKQTEVVSSPEISTEQESAPAKEEQQDQTSSTDEAFQDATKVSTRKVSSTHHVNDRLVEEIEGILEEDLKEIYQNLPPDKKFKFKEQGEETVTKIRKLTDSTKVNAKKVFELIRKWLKIIPGVNRFFLEQEAKIKTDKILMVVEEEKKQKENEL